MLSKLDESTGCLYVKHHNLKRHDWPNLPTLCKDAQKVLCYIYNLSQAQNIFFGM
jgi:hypothetical protein